MRMRKPLSSRVGPVPGAILSSAVADPVRHGYHIIALCSESHTGVVEGAMRDEFETSRIRVDNIGAEPHSCRALTRVCAQVRCSNAERSSLVRLVHRLGLMPAVRSIRWESIPGATNVGRKPPTAARQAPGTGRCPETRAEV
jgi:hypothetical protein